MVSHKRGPWSPGEDSCLLQLVHTQGAHNWVRISVLIGSRSPKQCRERFHQNLKPTLSHDPITPEEGILIERLVNEMGKRWAEIARRLDGRSDNAVKNWWNGGMNRRRRLVHRRGDPNRMGRQFQERAEPLSFARAAASHEMGPARMTLLASGRAQFETPLPSPSALSDISRADSTDGVPSLMSDCASTHSTSPQFPQSPHIDLPPLLHNRAVDRRPSLPMMHLGPSNGYIPESEMQKQQPLSPMNARPEYTRPILQPTAVYDASFRRPSLPSVIQVDDHHYMRYQAVAPLPSPTLQLPSFQSLASPAFIPDLSRPFDHAERKDRRMNVSNLLD
jgi:Myb-like DNA-binding protein FlbD